MTPAVPRPPRRTPALAWAFALSFLLHAALAGALLGAHPAPPKVRAPSYRVNLVAAPAAPEAAPAPAAPTPPAAKRAPAPRAMPAPAKEAKQPPPKPAAEAAVAAAPAAPAPAPAAAAEPGRGTDVVGVRTEGAEFPYPVYLENIVRQIALRFKVPRNSAARAEVMFVVRRDGSIVPNSLQFVSRSGNFAFDLEAQGAIEQAGAVKAFGPLPAGFADDVLPVVFSFDPKVLH